MMSRLVEVDTHKTNYLEFIKFQQTGKKTYHITVKNLQGEQLGIIVYRNGWRTYVFQPYGGFQFDHKCLKDIVKYIDKINAERKANLRGS